MHLQYESYDDILSEEKGFGRKIVEEIIDNKELDCSEKSTYAFRYTRTE